MKHSLEEEMSRLSHMSPTKLRNRVFELWLSGLSTRGQQIPLPNGGGLTRESMLTFARTLLARPAPAQEEKQ